jgi:hypothetical protein
MISVSKLSVAAAVIVPWFVAPLSLAQEVVLRPQQLSAHCWFFQGEPSVASLANKG